MRTIKNIFVILILIILQIQLGKWMSYKYSPPNLLLIYCVYISLKKDLLRCATAGFFLGLINDFIGGHIFGLSSLGFICVATLSNLLKGQLFLKNVIYEILLVLAASFIFNWVFIISSYFSSDHLYGISYSMILITSLISPILFKVFNKYDIISSRVY